MVFQTANGDLRIPHNHNRWIQMCKPPDWQTEPSSTMVLCILMLTGVLRMAAWVHKGAADWDCIKEMNVTAFPIESFQRQQQSRIRGRAFGKQIHSTCCWDICISSCALGNRSYRSSEAVWAVLFNDTLWYYRRTCLSIYQRCTTENVCFFLYIVRAHRLQLSYPPCAQYDWHGFISNCGLSCKMGSQAESCIPALSLELSKCICPSVWKRQPPFAPQHRLGQRRLLNVWILNDWGNPVSSTKHPQICPAFNDTLKSHNSLSGACVCACMCVCVWIPVYDSAVKSFTYNWTLTRSILKSKLD